MRIYDCVSFIICHDSSKVRDVRVLYLLHILRKPLANMTIAFVIISDFESHSLSGSLLLLSRMSLYLMFLLFLCRGISYMLGVFLPNLPISRFLGFEPLQWLWPRLFNGILGNFPNFLSNSLFEWIFPRHLILLTMFVNLIYISLTPLLASTLKSSY